MAKPSPRRSRRSRRLQRMENFRKVRSEEAPAGGGAEEGGPGSDPFGDLAPGAVHMRVKEGSKIRNLLAFATASMAQPSTRAIVFSGCGRATTKTVTCAEILKRRLAGLHQVTRLRYRSVREVWQSRPPGPTPGQPPGEPAASLSVVKNVPGLAILLSKDALDPGQPGYQPPTPHPGPLTPPAAPIPKRSLGSLQRAKAPRNGCNLSQRLRTRTKWSENFKLQPRRNGS